jgi:AcrR family transcriptional regulator
MITVVAGSQPARSLDAAASGRERQRLRTRNAIVAAAAHLLRDGQEATVAAAAARADVSRATAYRYFPTQDDLLSEATLELTLDGTGLLGTVGMADEVAALAASTDDDVERVAAIVRRCGEWALEHQGWLRRNLRSSLPASPLAAVEYHRPGHRHTWIDHALGPLRGRVASGDLERLHAALVALTGVEPIVALVDVGGYDRDTVLDTLAWAAAALTREVCGPPTGRERRRSAPASASPRPRRGA